MQMSVGNDRKQNLHCTAQCIGSYMAVSLHNSCVQVTWLKPLILDNNYLPTSAQPQAGLPRVLGGHSINTHGFEDLRKWRRSQLSLLSFLSLHPLLGSLARLGGGSAHSRCSALHTICPLTIIPILRASIIGSSWGIKSTCSFPTYFKWIISLTYLRLGEIMAPGLNLKCKTEDCLYTSSRG